MVADRTVLKRCVDDWKFAQRFDGGSGDKGHVGKLDAVALLVLAFLALAERGDAGHVHLENSVDMRADLQTLHHALRDDGAHLGQRHQFASTCGAAAQRSQPKQLQRARK